VEVSVVSGSFGWALTLIDGLGIAPVADAVGCADGGLDEFRTYICNNREFIPNFGERRRQGETISTAFVESTINQVVSKGVVKKQQMGWSQRGAHLLLQIRTRVLDEEWENTFQRWYPDFRPRAQAKKAA
jgi:hypothetical protein